MPWIIPAIGATVGLVGSAVQGDQAAKAATAQQEAAAAAQKRQEEIFAQQQSSNAALTQQGIGAIGQYGQMGAGAIQGGVQGANAALGQGLQYGQNAIYGGLGQAGGSLGNVTGLAGQFTPGATQAIQTPEARSRLGEMYAGNFNLQMDPGYQFRQQAGEQAINRMASAAGGRGGGAALKSLVDFNSGLASQEYGAAFGRQAGLASGADQASMQQAAMQQQGLLAAQQNQMGLAQMGYGGYGQLAGMQYGAGNQLAGMGQNMYGQMGGNLYGGGIAQGNLYGQMGQGVANMYGQQMSLDQQIAMANAGVQGSGVNLAGGQNAAWANAAGQVAGGNFAIAGGSAGMAGQAMGGGGDSGGFGQEWADQGNAMYNMGTA